MAIEPGSLYGFLGPNGAGKSTTIRVLLGFLRPTSGTARVLGLDCWTQSERLKAEVGAIPGDVRLWPWLTGQGALKLFGQIRGRDLLPQGKKLADELELDLGVRVRAMSRGMRQKLGLILAMAHQPAVLILDEPTTALDPLMQDRLRKILRRMANAGHTVFFSSHTLSEVEELCERVAIVKQGKIVADSTLEELRRQNEHDVVILWKPGAAMPGDASTPAGDQPVPGFLALSERSRRRWAGRLRGPVQPLMGFLAAQPVEDVTIARPSLENIFRRFYEDDVEVTR